MHQKLCLVKRPFRSRSKQCGSPTKKLWKIMTPVLLAYQNNNRHTSYFRLGIPFSFQNFFNHWLSILCNYKVAIPYKIVTWNVKKWRRACVEFSFQLNWKELRCENDKKQDSNELRPRPLANAPKATNQNVQSTQLSKFS